MESANHIKITQGDFLKNAGIIGMYYLLKNAGASFEKDYGYEEQTFWVDREFAINADWTDMYFKAFVKYLGPTTIYPEVIHKIETTIEKLKTNSWTGTKEENDDLKYINDKLLSNSYQSGFENIKEKICHPEVYEKLKQDKLKEKMPKEELLYRLEELKEFLQQELCNETFHMKSIIYNYINRFWDGKCFLLRANAKKDMRVVFENDFSDPFKMFLKNDNKKRKDMCIDCGQLIDGEEKVSIAFMKDVADDLSRKKSAFWNCKVDAYLCPICAFVYALSPLGFQLLGEHFLFVNNNCSVEYLLNFNAKDSGRKLQAEKKEEETKSTWLSRIMHLVLQDKLKELANIQVIIRSIKQDEADSINIINREVLDMLEYKKIRHQLENLAEQSFVKDGNDFINVYEKAVSNILEYRNQYALLNHLLKLSIDNKGIVYKATPLFEIQVGMNEVRNGIKEKGGKQSVSVFRMKEEGKKLKKELLQKKGLEVTNDENLRGSIYQLLNALSVGNKERFMEIAVRLYASCKLPIPDEFIWMLQNQEQFLDNGYAFLFGLKGDLSEKEDK